MIGAEQYFISGAAVNRYRAVKAKFYFLKVDTALVP
jgi:hypothetical protein